MGEGPRSSQATPAGETGRTRKEEARAEVRMAEALPVAWACFVSGCVT